MKRIQMSRAKEAQTWAGVRQARVARSTGTLIVIFDGAEAGLDTDGGAWTVLCDDHGETLATRTLEVARWHAVEPESWCSRCGESA